MSWKTIGIIFVVVIVAMAVYLGITGNLVNF